MKGKIYKTFEGFEVEIKPTRTQRKWVEMKREYIGVINGEEAFRFSAKCPYCGKLNSFIMFIGDTECDFDAYFCDGVTTGACTWNIENAGDAFFEIYDEYGNTISHDEATVQVSFSKEVFCK